jgi:hypothetical protein
MLTLFLWVFSLMGVSYAVMDPPFGCESFTHNSLQSQQGVQQGEFLVPETQVSYCPDVVGKQSSEFPIIHSMQLLTNPRSLFLAKTMAVKHHLGRTSWGVEIGALVSPLSCGICFL